MPKNKSLSKVKCVLATVCLGPTNFWTLGWTLHEGMMPPVVRNGPAVYSVPGYMKLNHHRARYVSFYPKTLVPKCMGPELAGIWAVPILAFFLCNWRTDLYRTFLS